MFEVKHKLDKFYDLSEEKYKARLEVEVFGGNECLASDYTTISSKEPQDIESVTRLILERLEEKLADIERRIESIEAEGFKVVGIESSVRLEITEAIDIGKLAEGREEKPKKGFSVEFKPAKVEVVAEDTGFIAVKIEVAARIEANDSRITIYEEDTVSDYDLEQVQKELEEKLNEVHKRLVKRINRLRKVYEWAKEKGYDFRLACGHDC